MFFNIFRVLHLSPPSNSRTSFLVVMPHLSHLHSVLTKGGSLSPSFSKSCATSLCSGGQKTKVLVLAVLLTSSVTTWPSLFGSQFFLDAKWGIWTIKCSLKYFTVLTFYPWTTTMSKVLVKSNSPASLVPHYAFPSLFIHLICNIFPFFHIPFSPIPSRPNPSYNSSK